ncbi:MULTISPECIES: MMPL family transporter [unclassified Corynebacterium]|uniref:MMPL family transporter n=1 Tax=unclassified Corynebacterium TaxID=2624378 RepID=UPI0029CA59E2|nr:MULTISPECIES: MMPL family transporter [unclassified Corynebacterium]WPF66277.1 MMPL family transporter [Corynebacterium sp. 22KM0430]WPF68767.1 MMPL family transporter [Corynebacterium sp. 21KM1197]
MAELLYSLGRWSFRRKWWVLCTWLLVLAAMAGAALSLMRPFTNQFSINNSPAIEATRMLVRNFPDQGNPVTAASVNVVFQAPEGEKLSDPQNVKAIDDVIAALNADLGDLIADTQRFGNPVTKSAELEKQVIQTSVESGLPEESAKEDAANLRLLSEDQTIGYTTFALDVDTSMDVTQEQRDAVTAAMEKGRAEGLTVEAGGAGFGEPIAIKASSEVVGLVVAFVVLIFTFGSLVAAGLPLITAVIGVGIGVLGILLTTRFVELNNITPTLAVMIGLAVGIDYALFILARYRAERARLDPERAAGMAVGTAGTAVVFAAVTVIVALAALAVAGIGFLTAMGLLAAFTVFVSLLVALTLVPALLGIAGEKAFAGAIPGIAGNKRRAWRRRPGSPGRSGGASGDKGVAASEAAARPASHRLKSHRRAPMSMGRRWVLFVHKLPGLTIAVVVLGLGALSFPVSKLEMALPSDSTSNLETTQRKSADLMAEGFGPGVNSPFLLVVDAHEVSPEAPALKTFMEAQGEAAVENPQRAAALSSFIYAVDTIDGMAGVKNAQLVGANGDQTAAQIMVTPFTGPDDQKTVALSHALRERAHQIADATGTTVGLTGLTAVQMDITETLEDAMPLYLGIVVGLAIVLLLLVFRSIMVPLVAGLGFLLSVGAAFGVTVLVWQEGLWGLVGTPAPLISFMPIFLIGVTFGLAMDYQVFLVTRMREHYTHSGGVSHSRYTAVEESIIEGFTQGARVVTAAALIMIAVFVAFIDQPLPFIQIFGFALGMGVLFDAFFVRMALVPAAMFVLGRATWWMPRWLDKILPSLDVEGSALEKKVIGKA